MIYRNLPFLPRSAFLIRWSASSKRRASVPIYIYRKGTSHRVRRLEDGQPVSDLVDRLFLPVIEQKQGSFLRLEAFHRPFEFLEPLFHA